MATPHSADIEAQEKKLEELKRTFDLYFQGLEKKPPFEAREHYLKELSKLRSDAIKWKLVERYRVNTLHQKYSTYGRLWDRTLKAIEEGTYRRDRLKMNAKKKREEEEAPPPELPDTTNPQAENVALNSKLPAPSGIDLPAVPAPVAAGAPRPAPRPVPRPAAAGGGDGGMNDQRMKQLYDVYMQAKKRTGEQSSLTYDQLASQIKKQIPTIQQKHGCKDVEFKVVLKDGKAMLKAIPK